MPRIQYCSDLHLEFPSNRAYIAKYPIEAKGDILILAGDIVPFSSMQRLDNFWDELSGKFQHTYWVPGNHEYYHSDVDSRTGTFHEAIRENVSLVNNYVTTFEGVKLIFSTLWSQLSDRNAHSIQLRMADFRVIKSGNGLLTPVYYNYLHNENRAFLEKAVSEIGENEQAVVATHHAPTFQNYPAKYAGSTLNEAFAVDLDDLIAGSRISHWIFGHHHCNFPAFKIGNTNLCTNQLGYVHIGEEEGFDPGTCLSL